MSVGKKLMIGPSLTLHGGWQLVPLDAARQYGPKELFLVASTSAAVTLSTDASNSWILPAGQIVNISLDGAPLAWAKGSDLVSSGAFATTGAWWISGAHSDWAVVGGSAHHSPDAAHTGILGQTLSIENATVYEVQFDVGRHPRTGRTGPIISLGGATTTTLHAMATGADYSVCLQTANATGPLRFTAGASGTHISIDNVSVKKVTGSQLLFAKGTAGVILQVMFTL